LLRELLSVKVSELWREPTGKVLLMRVTVTDGWVGRPLTELEASSGARVAWLVRFGEAQLPTASTVLQTGDHLVMATTDEHTGRVHSAVEQGPSGGHH
jgi:trk system potassium uptake protein